MTRAPVGVFNLRDVACVLGGIIAVPYLYLALPRWLVAGLLILSLSGLIYYTCEPVLRARWSAGLVTCGLVAVELATAQLAGGTSAAFLGANNLVLIVVIVGLANLWAQSGMRARDAAGLAAGLTVYDFIATAQLPMMGDLFRHLAGLPFSPLLAWSIDPAGHWLGLGLGDVLLAATCPLVLRKAFGRRAGLTALLLAGVALGALLLAPLPGIFPVMIVLGPLMVAQYGFWARRSGAERTTWQYRQAEP
jgi:hypothetical protein